MNEVPDAPGPHEGPQRPSDLGKRGIVAALKRTLKEARDDNLTSWAAALTYYGVLSIFPGLLVLVAVLGMLDDSLIQSLQDHVGPIMPEAAREIFDTAIVNVRSGDSRPGVAATLGLLVAVWSASGYVSEFMTAANAIYDVPEGRPFWKLLPIRLLVTIGTGVLLIASTAIVVLSGRLSEQIGSALGIEAATVGTWNVIKWPILIVLVSQMLAILYWVCPNVKQKFRWVTPGGVFAVVAWILISLGFGLYVANFGSYNKTYGAVAGVIIFLIWLWLSNVAILLGAELDAELLRGRAIATGFPVDHEPYVELRDAEKADEDDSDGSPNSSGTARQGEAHA